MDNINEIQTQMKIELTKTEIDKIYFSLVDYIKIQTNVDRLYNMSTTQQEMYKTELEIINKFVGLGL